MWGALLGVAILIAVPEVIGAFNLLPTAYEAPVERIIYGLIVLAFVVILPRGILPERPILRLGSAASRRAAAPEREGAAT
jgi:ABC-type branched-subunit amino acid transport system permease subunit